MIADQNAIAAKRREPWLLLLVGADAPQNAQTLMTELQGAPTVLSHVVAAERVDGLRWNLVLKDRTVVKLPDAGEAAAIHPARPVASDFSSCSTGRWKSSIFACLGELVVRPYPVPQARVGKVPAHMKKALVQ